MEEKAPATPDGAAERPGPLSTAVKGLLEHKQPQWGELLPVAQALVAALQSATPPRTQERKQAEALQQLAADARQPSADVDADMAALLLRTDEAAAEAGAVSFAFGALAAHAGVPWLSLSGVEFDGLGRAEVNDGTLSVLLMEVKGNAGQGALSSALRRRR